MDDDDIPIYTELGIQFNRIRAMLNCQLKSGQGVFGGVCRGAAVTEKGRGEGEMDTLQFHEIGLRCPIQ